MDEVEVELHIDGTDAAGGESDGVALRSPNKPNYQRRLLTNHRFKEKKERLK